ncbi:hypothetical protein BASA61_010313 [Batrachochytrium salamandrivorans]|nr:hypothetical protein BASA61_010313 [Batrachochytrium salamandrivorans]KAH9250796.1 hypothetical protein BASA81_011384 [Batrachochytrium salamandrivorans]
MRLISFAMVSLLAITVSAYPPHNPDTQNTNPSPDDAIQNMDQSPSISAEDMEGLMEFDTEMLDQLLNDAVQNAQQPQDAATHSAQQSPGATSQDLGQPLSYILRDIREFQGISAQEIDEVLGATSQDLEQYLDAAIQDIHEFQGISAQEVDEVLDATTQSAQQSPDAATQDIQKSQYTATQMLESFLDAAQSVQQSNQDKVLVEMNRLTEAYKIQNNRCSQIDIQINTEKQRDKEVGDMMKTIAMKLRRPSLSNNKRLELQQTARNLRMMADELTAGYQEQHQNYKDAIIVRNEMYAELQILKGNQELIAKHNSKNVFKVGLSHGSCYNIGILETQYDDITKDIDRLLVKQKKLGSAVRIYGGSDFRVKSERLENELQDLQNYNVVARRILRQHKYNKPIYV